MTLKLVSIVIGKSTEQICRNFAVIVPTFWFSSRPTCRQKILQCCQKLWRPVTRGTATSPVG